MFRLADHVFRNLFLFGVYLQCSYLPFLSYANAKKVWRCVAKNLMNRTHAIKNLATCMCLFLLI